MEIKGTLPVALKMVVGQTEVKSKQVVMRQMTTLEYLQSQSQSQPDQFIALIDLTSMTKLIDDDGNEHKITYDMLAHSSRSNFDYLTQKRAELDAKEQAES